jgi:chromate transporter
MQFAVLLAGSLIGWLLYPNARLPLDTVPPGLRFGTVAITICVFCGLFLILPVLALIAPHGLIALADILYRAGALVFGGGHVVLPLLRDALVAAGWISDDAFLSGYGFAQVLPGPLFAFGAYIGATSAPPHASALWAIAALLALFLPGMLLAISGAALLGRLSGAPKASAVIVGINAVVVGILGAALYSPLCTTAIRGLGDGLTAVSGFVLLQRWRVSPLLVAALCIVASELIAVRG